MQIFERKEKKYILSEEKYSLLLDRISEHMKEDKYGLHTICSLYYDTNNYDLIKRSSEKPTFKEKFRVRTYGVPSSEQMVYLEIKKKLKGIVYKRRISMRLSQVDAYMKSKEAQEFDDRLNQQISNEIFWLKKKETIAPKVIISYDRRAFSAYKEDEFRVTFDAKIRWRNDDLQLANGHDGELVAPEIDVLMEVKSLHAYPLWFVRILSDLDLYPSKFSKYEQVYRRYLNNQKVGVL
ncbi:molecular chaperone [Listeria newyorkensis]|uniref:Molecular chaperone n=1 Tax=Listeria newyorkensis TaxID=1497681 RepID=A0ABX4XR20_9LIST|nr:polyphosphate polymerase domain-containing protein [Listeria newyorkensis]KGL43939.1 molecular chaperone [Listeria newyorkensis]PNP94930.1 molecular chaperone [Listeria newyorkensis]WAO21877.1 polyphosphate polymerase domain-containing protein [Listeria newyorkensis]SQC59848.1 VTC domain [Listeria newyorkensis]